MTPVSRVIVMEFNELSPVLMEKFMLAGKLPSFRRFHDEAEVWTTEADAPAPQLEPWIQWVTVHSGVPFSEHGIEHLTDGYKLEHKSIWDQLSDAGQKVWVCGSMNVKYETPINGWVLPDPWTANVPPHPEEILAPYFRFVSANVQEHTRSDVPLTRAEQVEFLKFMARHGLQPATVAALARQIASERFSDAHWKRATLLDRLQFDLFRWYWERERPDFATLFLNSTAHYQHVYWRNMEPEHFKIKPDPGEQEVYEDAILFGYQQMDKLCARLMKMAGDDVTLVLVTALSQQPCLDYEEIGGKAVYRPVDFDRLLSAVGIDTPAKVTPVMAEDFRCVFENEEDARSAERKLGELSFDDRPAIGVKRIGAELQCGCRIWEQVAPDAMLSANGATIPFFDLFYSLNLLKSGSHHPDGIFWIRTRERRHVVREEKTPLTSVAPTILKLCGLEEPSHVGAEPLLS